MIKLSKEIEKCDREKDVMQEEIEITRSNNERLKYEAKEAHEESEEQINLKNTEIEGLNKTLETTEYNLRRTKEELGSKERAVARLEKELEDKEGIFLNLKRQIEAKEKNLIVYKSRIRR